MENERIGMENTIYVEDVNQVQYQKIPGITDSEMAMIKWVAQGMDLGTVDQNQQGIAGRGVTAREIVIANENAKKLKGIFFMFLTDLWVQKTKLRILNILQNYTQPKVEEIVGPDGKTTYQESFRSFLVEGSEFPDGSTGTLEIQMVKDASQLPTPQQLDMDEEKMRIQGRPYQKMAMTSSYIDNYEYDVQVVPESLYSKDSSEAQALVQEKIRTMMLAFPRIFMANEDVVFEDFADAYGEDPTRYNLTPPPPVAPTVPAGGENTAKVAGAGAKAPAPVA
jgi:hypothetical protein